MTASVLVLLAALGQTTQPAGPPENTGLSGPRITVATQPAQPPRSSVLPRFPGVTTRPGMRVELPVGGEPLITPTTMPSDMASMLAGLSGNRVQVEVLPDGSLVFIGEPEDIAIWQNFLAQLEEAPGVKPVFRVFQLQNAQAATLAPQIAQIWNQAHQPVVGRARAEDRISVIPEPRANILMVATAEMNMPEVARIIEELDRPSFKEDQPILFQPIPLQHIQAAEAETVLRDMLQAIQQRKGVPAAAEPVTIRADTRTNSLLISASQADFEQIRKLIEIIDVPPAPGWSAVKLAIFPLKKAVASQLAAALNELLTAPPATSGRPGGQAMREQIRRLQMVFMGAEGGRQLPDLDLSKQVRVWPEDGTNSIIVATSEENLEPMRAIIELLDSVPLADEITVRLYPLQYADAETLQTNIRTMFDQGSDLPELPGRTQINDRVPVNPEGQALAYRLGLAFDRRTNTLLVAGRAEQIQLVEEIIRRVDVKGVAYDLAPRLVRLKNADAQAVTDILTRLIEQRQNVAELAGPTLSLRDAIVVVPDPRTNSVVIISNEENFTEVSGLVRELDQAESRFAGEFQIVSLENLTAADLATKIEELWARRTQLRQQANLPADEPVIIADARTNSLLISANPDDLAAITSLVNRLEQQKISPMMEIRTVIIRNTDPARVAEALTDIFQQRLENSRVQGQEELPTDRVAIIADPLTKTLLVASSKANFDEVVRLVTLLDVPPALDSVIRTFPIRNADVTKVGDMIRELFDGGVYQGANVSPDLPEALRKVTVVADERSSTLIVSASPENLNLVDKLVQQVDAAEMPLLTGGARFFPVRNADVVRVAGMLDQLLQGIQATLQDQDQLQFRVIPDPRTRTLLVSGTRYALQQAELLVPKLDVAAGQPEAITRVYTLEQASARQLQPILTELFEQREQGTPEGVNQTPVLVQAAEGANSIIVTASTEQHAIVQDLLEKLDRPGALAQQMRVFPLEQARADQLADTLQTLLQEQLQGTNGGPPVAVTPEPRTNSLIVFAPPDLMNNIAQIIDSLDTNQPAAQMALRVFKLYNATAQEMAERLQEFFQQAAGDQDGRRMIIRFHTRNTRTGQMEEQTLVYQDVTITPDPATNSLLVLAPRDSMDMMARLIEMLDEVELQTAEVEVFQLRNADATDMRDMLQELFETGAGAAEERTRLIFGGEGIGPGAAPGAGGGGAQGAVPGAGVLEVSFSVDRRTNSLIAAGSPANLRIVERLVIQLDSREIDDRIVRVVHLRNAQAEEVAETLSSYFEGEAGLVEEGAEGEAAFRRVERQVTVQSAGETQNTLLLAYSPRLESQIINIINELDLPPPQVMIQVLMAEVTLDDRLEMGMEFAVQDLLFSERSFVRNGVLQGDNKDFVFGTDLGAQGQSGLGGISFTITGEDFNFLIRSLQTEGRLEVISRPSILVQDNKDANITVGERVPTIQDINISTTGFVTPSVSYEEVGVILDVTPIINPDGFVNLQIRPEISAIGTSSVTVASGISLPTFTERSAETEVTVKDGETIIIGGLITNRSNESENKVPLAGDIPLLGNLFRATVKTNTKTELLIVLTPHVIRDAEQARRVSIGMRDESTGLMENIGRSPLMGRLQISPEEQFGPPGPAHVVPPDAPPPAPEEYGPVLEEYGPPMSSIRKEDPDDPDMATFRIRPAKPEQAAQPVQVGGIHVEP